MAGFEPTDEMISDFLGRASPDVGSAEPKEGLDEGPEDAVIDAFVAKRTKEQEARAYDAPVTAGALGAARSVSLGLSDQLLTKTGLVEPETLRKYQDFNPTASTVGEVAGVVAPLVATGGTSLLARGAASAGKGVLAASRAGSAVEGAVARKLLPMAGSSVAKQIAAKSAAAGAGSAAEASFYGAGKLISEEALGNADFTAENILSHVGGSALFGLGLGGAARGAIDVTKLGGTSLLEKTNQAYQKVKSFLSDTKTGSALSEKFASASSLLSGVEKSSIQPLVDLGEEGVKARKLALMPEKQREEIMKDSIRIFDDHYEQMNKISGELSTAVRDMETKALLTDIDPVATADVKRFAGDVLKASKKELLEMSKKRGTYSGTARIAKVQEAIDDLELMLKGAQDPNDVFQAMNTTKREIDTWAKHDQLPSIELQPTVDKIKEMAGRFRTHLEDVEIYGSAGAAQAQFNNRISEFLDVKRTFEQSFMKKLPDGSYRFDPVKFNTFLNQAGLERNALREEVLDRWMNGSNTLINELELMASGVPAVTRAIDQSPALATARNLSDDFNTQLQKQLEQATQRQNYKELRRGSEQIFTYGDFIVPAAGFLLGGFPGLALGASLRTLKNPAGLIEGLGAIERIVQSNGKKIDSAISSLLAGPSKGAAKLASKPSPLIPISVQFFEPRVSENKDGIRIEQSAAYKEYLQKLSDYAVNPQGLTEVITKKLQGLGTIAPQASEALSRKSAEIAQFLYEKAPKNPTAPSLFNAKSQDDWKPSDFELASFARTVTAIENPMSVIEDLARGELSVEGPETLKRIYPELYQRIQQTLLEKASEKKINLPYSQRLQLALLFDISLEEELQPQAMQAFQQSFSTPDPSEMKPPTSTQLKSATNALTNVQRREFRQ